MRVDLHKNSIVYKSTGSLENDGDKYRMKRKKNHNNLSKYRKN